MSGDLLVQKKLERRVEEADCHMIQEPLCFVQHHLCVLFQTAQSLILETAFPQPPFCPFSSSFPSIRTRLSLEHFILSTCRPRPVKTLSTSPSSPSRLSATRVSALSSQGKGDGTASERAEESNRGQVGKFMQAMNPSRTASSAHAFPRAEKRLRPAWEGSWHGLELAESHMWSWSFCPQRWLRT